MESETQSIFQKFLSDPGFWGAIISSVLGFGAIWIVQKSANRASRELQAEIHERQNSESINTAYQKSLGIFSELCSIHGKSKLIIERLHDHENGVKFIKFKDIELLLTINEEEWLRDRSNEIAPHYPNINHKINILLSHINAYSLIINSLKTLENPQEILDQQAVSIISLAASNVMDASADAQNLIEQRSLIIAQNISENPSKIEQ